MRSTTLVSALFFCAITVPAAAPVAAQTPGNAGVRDDGSCEAPEWLERDGIGGGLTEFSRLAEITGRTRGRPGLIRRWSDDLVIPICGEVPWGAHLRGSTPVDADGGPSVRVLPVRSLIGANTAYPNDRNNGARWGGRGLSAEVGGGVALRWGPLSAALAPAIVYEQNAEFLESPWREIPTIDWPQRFGTRSFASLEPGQSFLRIDTHGVATGISTENVWLGPGINTSILLSNTAPGFAHWFLKTSDPVDIHVGNLEVEVMYGRLVQSPFFEDEEASEHRLFTSLVFNFEPHWLPGLYLGGARVLNQNLNDDTLLFPFLHGLYGSGGRDELDQFLALYGRWVLPESGFEAFVEWVRNDGAADFHGLITELDHSVAYVIGLQKVQEVDAGWLRVRGEVASLNPRLPAFRHIGQGAFYTHGDVRQGYTHRGQLLGASIGTGSDSQLLGVDLFTGWGSGGLYVERVRRAVHTFFRNSSLRQGSPFQYDLELTLGGRAAYFIGDVRADMGLAYSHRRSRDFLPPDVDELERGYRVDPNWNVELGVHWHPRIGPWSPVADR